jgi:hypothetical protein
MFNAIGGSNYDFVELRNLGPVALDLNGVRFVQGIAFTFGPQVLSPGGSIIVAKDVARFRLRYGTSPRIAGAFSGELDNGGEKLALRLPPPFDANILTFEYNDAWFPAADGDGAALTITSPASVMARDWDERETWTQSAPGGDPDDTTPRWDTFAGWMAVNHALTPGQDDDHDGVPALIEFVLGMNPTSGLGHDGPLGLPVPGVDAQGRSQITFFVPQNAEAFGGIGFPDGTLRVDASSTLLNWSTIASKSFISAWSGSVTVGAAVNGYIPVTVTDSILSGPRRFLRLSVDWQP